MEDHKLNALLNEKQEKEKEENLTEYYANKDDELSNKSIYITYNLTNYIKITGYNKTTYNISNYNPYSNLCGVNPVRKDGMVSTNTMLNREMDRITKNKEAREEYYKNVTGNNT